MNEIKILGIVGSQRKESCNRLALMAAQELVPPGVVLELVELHGIPFFERRNELLPPVAVIEFKRRLRAADAILFATPECNHAVPGGLKSAIDWASRSSGGNLWAGKPAGVLSASDGSLIAARSQRHLREMLAMLAVPTVGQAALINDHAACHFSPDGRLSDETARRFVVELMLALVVLVRAGWAARGFVARERA